jgi:hypothetical protein
MTSNFNCSRPQLWRERTADAAAEVGDLEIRNDTATPDHHACRQQHVHHQPNPTGIPLGLLIQGLTKKSFYTDALAVAPRSATSWSMLQGSRSRILCSSLRLNKRTCDHRHRIKQINTSWLAPVVWTPAAHGSLRSGMPPGRNQLKPPSHTQHPRAGSEPGYGAPQSAGRCLRTSARTHRGSRDPSAGCSPEVHTGTRIRIRPPEAEFSCSHALLISARGLRKNRRLEDGWLQPTVGKRRSWE